VTVALRDNISVDIYLVLEFQLYSYIFICNVEQVLLLYILMVVVEVMEREIVVLELVSTGGQVIQSKNFLMNFFSALFLQCFETVGWV